jgi:hypothetical protein
VPGVVEQVGVTWRRDGLAVVRRECRRDLVGIVDEVEDEGAVLVRVRAVESGQRLYRGETGEGLIDVHRVELRLVEPGLKLLGDNHDLVIVAVEPLSGLRLRKAVAPCLGERLASVGDHV